VTVSSCLSPPSPSSFLLVIILCRFGGYSYDRHCYNDTWSFDVSTRKWTELQCTGYTLSPRYRHAAAVVDDVMYVFGGRVDGASVDDLLAFKLSSKRFSFTSRAPHSYTIYSSAMVYDSKPGTKSKQNVLPCHGF
jgi:hypothetical protein